MRRINWFGVVLLIVGALMLLNALGIGLYIGVGLFWPAVLVCIGLISAISGRRVTFWNCLLVVVGVYWALVTLGAIMPLDMSAWLPVLIILLGISILFPNASRARRSMVGDTFTSTSVFGGDKRTLVGKTFSGGDAVSLFGGFDLDLTGYEAFAPVSHIYAHTIFGGGNFIVPAHVRVERRGFTAIAGGLSIKGQPYPDAVCVLEVSGLALFGGITFQYKTLS